MFSKPFNPVLDVEYRELFLCENQMHWTSLFILVFVESASPVPNQRGLPAAHAGVYTPHVRFQENVLKLVGTTS